MDELFELEKQEKRPAKQMGRLHRKIFLLVFAVMLLAQGLCGIDKALADYHDRLGQSFKLILTLDAPASAEQLEQWSQDLLAYKEVQQVQFFSPEEALTVVRHKNPQLVDSLLLLGKNKMPAYFELHLSPAVVGNVAAWADQLQQQYEAFTVHYNPQQARLLFYTGTYTLLIRVLALLSLVVFMAFMFLVEAAPYAHDHAVGGMISGVLAAALAAGVMWMMLYPSGLLEPPLAAFTTWPRQLMLAAFGGLLGWTLSKWKKF